MVICRLLLTHSKVEFFEVVPSRTEALGPFWSNTVETILHAPRLLGIGKTGLSYRLGANEVRRVCDWSGSLEFSLSIGHKCGTKLGWTLCSSFLDGRREVIANQK